LDDCRQPVSPQDIFVPRDGIPTNLGHKSFDQVGAGIAAAIDKLLADPARAVGVCGAIADFETLARVEKVKALGEVVPASSSVEGV
jgi:NADPH-dependent curcumin reductase CurA